jgi:predicted RNA-binding protein with PUA domain
VDGKKKATAKLSSTGNKWTTQTVSVPLTPGNHRLRLNNVKQADNRMNWLRIEGEETDTTEPTPDEISIVQEDEKVYTTKHYDLTGREVRKGQRGLQLRSTIKNGSRKTEKILVK